MNKGLVYPDGKRVIKSLDDVAIALKDHFNEYANDNNELVPPKEIKLTWQFLQETFLQPDYTKYSEKTCKDEYPSN
jgi:hypothetical protein